MIYNILERKSDGFTQLLDNLLPYRSYFIPCSSQSVCDKGSLLDIRKISDRVFSLKGEADFVFLPEGKFPSSIDSLSFFNGKINIGESWESQNICEHRYADISFCKKNLSLDGGKNNKNSAGVYRKFFEVSDVSRTYYLSFLKVFGTFSVYVNGSYIGFSDIGRGEFDISSFVHLGQNEVLILVKKRSQASYLNFGKGFAVSGIVGDVLLYINNPDSLFDYSFVSKFSELGICGELKLDFAKDCTSDVFVQLFLEGKQVFSNRKTIVSGKAEFIFDGDYELYCAEKPVLYDLYIKILRSDGVRECVKVKIGFGISEINEEIFTYNKEPLKICAVSYNARYSSEGRSLSLDEIIKDMKLIKNYNFNAVCFEDVPDPIVIEFCLQSGLYVIEKFDINTEAVCLFTKKRDFIVKNDKFAPIISELTKAVFSRDKALANIVMYSFGSENGELDAISKAASYVKYNSNKICLYRSEEKTDFDVATVYNPDIDGLVVAINEVRAGKPVFMVEFAKSQGAGCASLREFFEIVEYTPCCLGGCITEFCDEVCDGIIGSENGLFNARRKPYIAAHSHKYICRPLTAAMPTENRLELFNKSYFAVADNIVLDLEVVKNGKAQSRFQIEGGVPPRSSRTFDVFLGHLEEDMYLNISYKNKSSGELIAKEQIPLSNSLNTLSLNGSAKPLFVSEFLNYLEIRFEGGYVRFSKNTGTIINYNLMGKELIKPTAERKDSFSFGPNIYRPFVRNMKEKSENFVIKTMSFQCEYDKKNPSNFVSVEIENVFTKRNKEVYIVQDKYVVYASGVIEVFSVVTPMRRGLEAMDCFGKQIKLQNSFGLITYYGRGCEENYIDVYQHANMGLYQTAVCDTMSDYTLKQEFGNHIDVHYAIISDKEGDGVALVARQAPFQLRVSPNSDQEIVSAYQNKLLNIPQSGVYVDVNAFVSGIGNTVKGKPLAQYLIKPTEYILHFNLVPVYNKEKISI